jgi:hypothetical protein
VASKFFWEPFFQVFPTTLMGQIVPNDGVGAI